MYKRRLRTHEFSLKFSLFTFGLRREFVVWDCVAMVKKFAVCAITHPYSMAAAVLSGCNMQHAD